MSRRPPNSASPPGAGPRSARAAALAACLTAAGAAACTPPQVGLRVRFPSLESFLVAATARIEIYDGTDAPDALCRALSVGQPAGTQALQSTTPQDVCLIASGLEIDPVEVGRLVIFAEADDAFGSEILRGCAVHDVTGLADEAVADEADPAGVVSFVEVQLATLPTYPEDAAPSCTSVEDKCERKVACSAQ